MAAEDDRRFFQLCASLGEAAAAERGGGGGGAAHAQLVALLRALPAATHTAACEMLGGAEAAAAGRGGADFAAALGELRAAFPVRRRLRARAATSGWRRCG